MNVLLIHQAFVSPKDGAGGTRHYELAQHVMQAGHSVTVVSSPLNYLSGKSDNAGEKSGLFTEQEVDGIRVLRAYTYPSLHKSFVWRIVSFLSFMASSLLTALRSGPADVVMGTSPPIFQAVSACFVAKLRRKPFLLEVRDLWPEFAVDMGVLTNPALIRLARRVERFLYRNATHILVNSPAYRDYLMKKGVPKRKISLISNGVDPEMFDPQAKGERIRQQWKLDGQFVVTYAGALGMANDIPMILRAAERLKNQPNIRILLVGDGKERAALEKQAQEMKLENVIFTGSHPKSEMTEFLAASDACLATLQNIPMFSTTYPNKVFDYMAAARPTLLAIDGVIREVVESAQGGVFVQPGDDAALAEAIQTLSADPQRARSMGEAAREYVVQHFNRNTQAAQFVELVETLAKSRAKK